MRSSDYHNYDSKPSVKATSMALNFLQTLKKNAQDYISIVAFDASGTKPLNETMIFNGDDMLNSYKTSLNQNIFQTQLFTNATATGNAISAAITNLTSSNSPIYRTTSRFSSQPQS